MKRLSLKIAVLVLVFGLTAFISLAFAGGPANKAMGNVDLEQSYGNQIGNQINFTFHAHMPKDGRPAKGNMSVITISTNPDFNPGSFWEASVTSVSINPTDKSAEFVGIVEASGDGKGGPHPSVDIGSKMWARVYDRSVPETAEVVLADFGGLTEGLTGGLTDKEYTNFCSWATGGEAAHPTINSSTWKLLGGNIHVKVKPPSAEQPTDTGTAEQSPSADTTTDTGTAEQPQSADTTTDTGTAK